MTTAAAPSQAATQAAAPDSDARAVRDIPSMLLPVQDKELLLPGVSVAEIVNHSYPDCPSDAPEWFLGYISWRQLSVPLVSFEVLNGQTLSPATGMQRIAVLNNTGVDERVPFVAITIQGIPRLMRILPKDVTEVSDVALAPAEMAAMNLYTGETVLVPNVSVLERALSQYLSAR